MKTPRPRFLIAMAAVVAASAGLTACVTINIYFPAAAAERAADLIIDEIYQGRRAAPPKPAAKPADAK